MIKVTYIISAFFILSVLLCGNVLSKDNEAKSTQGGKMEKSAVPKIKFSPKENKRNRNPFLSLDDISKIKAEEERKRKLLEKSKQKAAPKKKLTPFERAVRLIELQGIINDQAIVNGDPRKVGDVVFGATIIKIGNSYVIFKVGDKTFTKRLR